MDWLGVRVCAQVCERAHTLGHWRCARVRVCALLLRSAHRTSTPSPHYKGQHPLRDGISGPPLIQAGTPGKLEPIDLSGNWGVWTRQPGSKGAQPTATLKRYGVEIPGVENDDIT
jgi:hypothetical protein